MTKGLTEAHGSAKPCASDNDIVKIELLAPARNAAIAIAAVDHGADAVYMGAPSHGARQQAANSIEDIRSVVEYAHRFGVKVYITVNTIVYDSELPAVERLVWELYRIGVDALIVQDMALLQMNLPPIALHASTQCDIRTPEKARFLQDAGFSQLVLPRELSADEIRRFRASVDVPLEVFVHGALCVSYSGDCQASYLTAGRSANRGECAQICRYAFDLEDDSGRKLLKGKHLLSLKDMNRLDVLADMLAAGVTSFKIEGRLKDVNYVKNIVAAYSRALDKIVAANPSRYRRASRGKVEYAFEPDVAKSFNRGFTSYFLNNPQPGAATLASVDTPKWIGESVGTVRRVVSKRVVAADLAATLENGDGLGFFNSSGVYCGFRLNRVEGDRLFAASDIDAGVGTVLYRNLDKKWGDALSSDRSARRVITLSMLLRRSGNTLVLEVSDGDGVCAVASAVFECQPAKSPQAEARRRVLSKLGDTEFELGQLSDRLGDVFAPASV
ncbi:MAG: U32 family peptidase, partial [Muribaculaceae bacterium]|nr:U32 family peptidase [Muribaculaceae bacterium]